MAFTMKAIKSLLSDAGLPVDALERTAEEICSRHNTTLDAIKEERDAYKKDAETLVSVQAELDKLKSLPEDGYKSKYEKEHQDFEAYKQKIAAEETAAKIRKAYRKMLDELQIDKEDADLIMAGTKFDGMKLDGDNLVDADTIRSTIKTNYARYIPKEKIDGADVKKPPKQDNGKPEAANSRAAELAKLYHERRYGKPNTEVKTT